MDFSLSNFGKQLGYEQDIYVKKLFLGSFVADRKYDKLNLPKLINVKLPQISLDSYSSRLKSRSNIFLSIPVSPDKNDHIVYQAQPPIFIDLNNTFSINLKNIRVKITDPDNEFQSGCALSILSRTSANTIME